MSAKGDILSRRHIVPGQYMSWDKMSRDKTSPDPYVNCSKNRRYWTSWASTIFFPEEKPWIFKLLYTPNQLNPTWIVTPIDNRQLSLRKVITQEWIHYEICSPDSVHFKKPSTTAEPPCPGWRSRCSTSSSSPASGSPASSSSLRFVKRFLPDFPQNSSLILVSDVFKMLNSLLLQTLPEEESEDWELIETIPGVRFHW